MRLSILPLLALGLAMALTTPAQVLDKQKLLDRQTFWDNRDWDWYAANIPFLETPDPDIDTTYYYRWELVTKHAVYGSPESGYAFTEFIDRPFWSGRYGAISCPAGHQLYEVRWLKDRDYAQDYARYWFHTDGAQPRRYSTWLADATSAVALVQDDAFALKLLGDLVTNYRAWEKSHFSPEVGLFWQTGHDEGMEYNISSRQTQDIMHGAPGYRPTTNAYMYADARAIARLAKLASNPDLEKEFTAKADSLKEKLQSLCWDPQRQFFLHVYKDDETAKDGAKVRALTKQYESGQFAGNSHGREEIGFVPWQFNLPDPGKDYEAAWRFLMDRDYFFADFGPTTTERNDPQFLVTKTCCWWSGQSWPYATTQTLVAMANLLNNYDQKYVTRDDYFKLLKTYTLTHRKDGHPYIAEGANPDTGSWQGYDSPNHSEHYFHSGYNDLIITGLAGLRPRPDDTLEVNPLIPATWDYFCLDDVNYRGHRVTILWDKTGQKYGRGVGLRLIVDGNELASSPTLAKLTTPLSPERSERVPVTAPRIRPLNYAVNNDGHRFPRPIASYTSDTFALNKINDGQSWYHIRPTNRWTTEGSPNAVDWVGIDFGIARPIHTVKLYFLDDGQSGRGVVAPQKIDLEYFANGSWHPLPGKVPSPIVSHRPTTIQFPMLNAEKVRAHLTHAPTGKSGLTEFEAWGDGTLPIPPAPTPKGNLAQSIPAQPFPKATASFTSHWDSPAEAIDGKITYTPEPRNRWTAYESPNKTDWLEIDLGQPKKISRATLHLYDDHGGVQPPASYTLQYWNGQSFQDCDHQQKSPSRPTGSQPNEVTFTPVTTPRIRALFTHKGNARTGLTELELWPE